MRCSLVICYKYTHTYMYEVGIHAYIHSTKSACCLRHSVCSFPVIMEPTALFKSTSWVFLNGWEWHRLHGIWNEIGFPAGGWEHISGGWREASDIDRVLKIGIVYPMDWAPKSGIHACHRGTFLHFSLVCSCFTNHAACLLPPSSLGGAYWLDNDRCRKTKPLISLWGSWPRGAEGERISFFPAANHMICVDVGCQW